MGTIGKKDKAEIVKAFQRSKTDLGSSEVQIALLTERINHLIEHLKVNKKDHHTRRSLLILVGRRKRLMAYFFEKNLEGMQELAKRLKLKLK